jgi:hypothetical protein
MAFNVHYCDGEIASITISTVPASPEVIDECCGIIEKESQCCNDKVIKADIKSDQIIVQPLLFDFIAVAEYWKPQVFDLNENYPRKDTIAYYCDAHAPPLYLLYSQYTFYC